MQHHVYTGKFTYQRVRDTIETMLLNGEFAVGDRLPPIRELAGRFGCNYHTVRKGLESLIRDSWLESRNGSGVFVKGGSRTLAAEPTAPGAESVLAVVCHPLMQPNDSRFIASLHDSAEAKGLNLELHTVSSFAQPEKIFDRIALRGCLAVLLPLLRSDDCVEEIAACVGNYPMPFVVGTPFPGLEACCYESPEVFGLSTVRAMRTVFRYAFRLGFRHIALLLPAEETVKTVAHYLMGYADECRRHDRPFDLALCENVPGAMDALLADWERFRGGLSVICYDDEIAVRLYEAARRNGWTIPGDIAVVGLGDTPLAGEANPPLSSVEFPYDYVTRAMVDCALALRTGESSQLTLPVWQGLVVRQSCGGVRRAGSVAEAQKLLEQIRLEIQNEPLEGAK